MTYLYRYDDWKSHVPLKGDALRAHVWSHKKLDSYPHESLLAEEESLPAGKSIFRISFWKDETAMRRFVPCNGSASEMYIVQRVRANHPFFSNFRKESDDALPNSAWLFWKIDDRDPDQDWSNEGIPKSDLEVLDFDGTWKPYDDAEITALPAARFARLGFHPMHYKTLGGRLSTVFCASNVVSGPDGPVVALLILEPHNARDCILFNRPALQAIFDQLRQQTVDIPAESMRLYVFQEDVHTFHSTPIAEVPIREIWRETGLTSWWLGRLSRRRYELSLELDKNFKYWSLEKEFGRVLIDAFQLPRPARMIDRYSSVVARIIEPDLKLLRAV